MRRKCTKKKEGWLSGQKHLTANEAVRNGTGVRISHLPQWHGKV